jgi:hypothetical protein
MRTATAWISKLKSETLGKTFKVQDTNHRKMTGSEYRGTAMCGPINYTQIEYSDIRCKRRIGLPPCPSPIVYSIYDGGIPSQSGPHILDGGTPSNASNTILDGGNP